jgi:predicted nucleic acid-binding protein
VITAVDTSVLLDVLLEDPKFVAKSVAALEKATASGRLIICPVVWAEVRAALKDPTKMRNLMAGAGIVFDPFDEACSDLAGDLWLRYREGGGKREHLIPDFLVGAHALQRAAQLLARDRGFFRRYFSGLTVLEPAG